KKGTFPWSPCQSPASGVLPRNITDVSVNFGVLNFVPYGSYRYHVFLALYYWLPNGAVSVGGSTYRCLDTQSRMENIMGVFSPIGSTATYNPGDSFGWDNVTLGPIGVGQTYTLTANVSHQCQQDLKAWGLNPNTPCQLAGIEIGTEGFQFQEIDVNWYKIQFTTSLPQPLTGTFTVTPSAAQAEEPVNFAATATGGTIPYNYAWSFDDGSTVTGQNVSHTYSTPGTYTISCNGSANRYTVTVNGTSGSKSHSVTVTFSVVAADFSIAASPANATIISGRTGNSTVRITPIGSFAGTVALATRVSPSTG